MDFLERLAVQLVEARRMAMDGGVARGRLALLLFDNAAETLLRASAASYLLTADMYGNAWRHVDGYAPLDANDQLILARIKATLVSLSRRKRIEREFDALVDFVFEQKDWPLGEEFASCLKVLHRFRNAAYHRDEVRSDVLGPAVSIHAYLVAHLLQYRRAWIRSIDTVPPGVTEFMEGKSIADNYLGLAGAALSGDLEDQIAARLLRDFHLDDGEISQVLGEHLHGRLDAVERDLTAIADYLCPFPTSSREFAIRAVQCDPTEWDLPQPPQDIWVRPIEVTTESIDAWRDSATVIKAIDRALAALSAFGDLEREIAAFEAKSSLLAEHVDRAIQYEIDIARGK